MALYFLDTSALVKYYHDEPGSTWIRHIIDMRDENVIYLAEIAIAECSAAFALMTRTQRVRPEASQGMYREFLNDVLNEYRLIHLTRANINRAADLAQNHPLKGYDAIQLATALKIKELLQAENLTLTFVCGDERLLQAAHAEHLATANPSDFSKDDAFT